MLIGSYNAKIDKGGRIKIPERFRAAVEEEFGKELFITSLTDEAVQIYPLAAWLALTGIAGEGAHHLRPQVRNFMLRVNRKGTRSEIDSKGRVLISQGLREKAGLKDEVEVIGFSNHLEIWDKRLLDEKLEKQPLSDEDFVRIADLMPHGKQE